MEEETGEGEDEEEENEETQVEDKMREEELTNMLEQGELEAIGLNLEKEQTLCFSCAHVPCMCSLLKLEMNIKALEKNREEK